MPPASKTMGKDAQISVLAKYIHPSELIRSKWPNPVPGLRLTGTVIQQQTKKISHRDQLALVFSSPAIVNDAGEPIELHAVPHWCKILEEGPSEFFFTAVESAEQEEAAQEEQQPIPGEALHLIQVQSHGQIDHLDLTALSGVVDIDDDNQPLPENIPTTGESVADDIFGEWGHNGICERRKEDAPNRGAKIKKFSTELRPTIEQMFLTFLPMKWVKDVLLVETNKHIDKPVTMGEFLRWLGLWFTMAMHHFKDRRSFWSTKEVDVFAGAPVRLGEYMSRNRFENILSSLCFTDTTPPAYKDHFWEVRQMIDAWNENMEQQFSPSWISCLDESMSKWVNEYTCPGFMCVPRKPWPFGNEYHSICCAVTGIMYFVELMEGKDTPRE
jgi:hypothetical protein